MYVYSRDVGREKKSESPPPRSHEKVTLQGAMQVVLLLGETKGRRDEGREEKEAFFLRFGVGLRQQDFLRFRPPPLCCYCYCY